jgi:hypothetical protein
MRCVVVQRQRYCGAIVRCDGISYNEQPVILQYSNLRLKERSHPLCGMGVITSDIRQSSIHNPGIDRLSGER